MPNVQVLESIAVSVLVPQPIGTAAAGSTNEVSDAGHVHAIPNDHVTYSMMQNVSAEARILGRAAGAGAGDVTELTAAQVAAIIGTTLDHGALAGLADDDHTQYLLANGSRTGATSGAQAFTNGITAGSGGPFVVSSAGLLDIAVDSTGLITLGTESTGSADIRRRTSSTTAGGSLSIRGGSTTFTNAAGGLAQLVGGTADGTGTGGQVLMQGGTGGATSGTGGLSRTLGGSGGAPNGPGGIGQTRGGSGQGSGAGGQALLTGGTPGVTGAGGAAQVTGGPGGSTSGAAGAVTIAGGTPTDGNGGAIVISGSNGVGTNRNGGSVAISAGTATGSGTAGTVTIATGGSTRVTVAADGQVTLANQLNGTSAVFSSSLGVTGLSTLTGGFAAGADSTINGDLSVGTASAAPSGSRLYVTGGTLRATGGVWAEGTGTLLQVGPTGNTATVIPTVGGAPDVSALVATNVAGQTVASHLYVNESSRNTRAGFYLADGVSGAGAWGHWLTWTSSGAQPYVLGAGGTEWMRISIGGVVSVPNGPVLVAHQASSPTPGAGYGSFYTRNSDGAPMHAYGATPVVSELLTVDADGVSSHSDTETIVTRVQTTDATPTDCGSYTIPSDDQAAIIVAQIIGIQDDGSEQVVGMVRGGYYRNGGGATIIGSLNNEWSDASAGATSGSWAFSMYVTGNDVRVVVVGAAATTINWCARIVAVPT